MMAGAAAPHGIGFRPKKSGTAGAEVAMHPESTLEKHYDWRQLPRWWQLSMYLCMFAYVACLLWDLATLAPHDPTYAVFQAFAAAFFGGGSLLLHHFEGRWFAQWRMTRAASSSIYGVSKGSWWDRQPIWLITFTVAIIAGAIGGILLAEAMVFTYPAAQEGATTSGVFGYLPNVVAFNSSTIGSLAFSIATFSIGYSFYHAVLPFCLMPTSELPVWLLPILMWELLVRWALLMWRMMPYPGQGCMTGFGVGFLWPIHDCYRVIIRGVRMWGLPMVDGRCDFVGRLLKFATLPYAYYVFYHALPMVALKAAAGSYEFPNDDLHHFVPNPGMAILRWMDPEPSPNVTRAELTGIGMFEVLDFPIVPIWSFWYIWIFSPVPMAYFTVRAVDAKTAWPSQQHVWPVQTIATCLSCWTAPCALAIEQLLGGVLSSAGIAPVVVTWIVFIISTEANGVIAGLLSALTEIGSDPSTFEPELPQVVLILVGVLLNYMSLLPYTIDTSDFWLTLALVKLLPIAMDTVPWGDVRKARREPDTYPSLFFRNFPWEGTRFCIVVTQVCEILFFVFLLAPLVTIRRYSGIGVDGEPSGWIVCNDEPIGELVARLAIILVVSSTTNAAQFLLVGRACKRVSGNMVEHEHETSRVLPWPDGKLRSSSDILKGLGWRLIPCLLGPAQVIIPVTMRPALIPEECDNFPPMTNVYDSMVARLF